MKKKLLALSILPVLINNAFAAPDSSVFTLGEIRVTASGNKDSDNFGGSTVDIDEMRQQDRNTVGEALNLAPGISLSKVGARNEQMAYIRGFDLRQVPIYVDGIPVYVPYDGYVDLARFSTFDLSRIDVAKGFSSALYGANTLGGAINLVSRRPEKKFEGEVGGGIVFGDKGGMSGQQYYGNAGTNQGSWYLQVGASYTNQDFYMLPSSFTPTKTQGSGERNNSAQHDSKVNIKIGLTPNATDEYVFNYINQHGVKDVPPYTGADPDMAIRYWQWPYWDKESFYFLSKTQLGNHTLKFRAFYDTFKNSLSQFTNATYTTLGTGSSAPSFYNDFTTGFSVEDDIRIGERNQLQIAYNIKTDVHRENAVGQPVQTDKDQTQTLAIEDTHAVTDRLTLATGLSFQRAEVLSAQNYNSTTKVLSNYETGSKSALNGQVGLNYKLNDSDSVHATIARKSRFATIKDRYSYRMGRAIPNPELQPEKATHYEIGYRGKVADKWMLGANLFRSDITNMIQATSITSSISQQQNVGKVEVNGIELELRGSIGRLDLGGNYTLMNRANLSNNNKLTDTPKQKLFTYATWNVSEGWTVNGSFEANSMRYSSTDGKQLVPGYAVTNGKLGYRTNGGLLVEAGVRNMFDRLYSYTEGFPEAGRTYFVQFNQSM